MNGDFDAVMRAHATNRGPVTVTRDSLPVTTGLLIAWRPRSHHPARKGQAYTAIVNTAGRNRTYRLNTYTVELTA